MTTQTYGIEVIAPDLLKIEVPLPKSPLRVTNSYLVLGGGTADASGKITANGGGRNLLIDTGFNHPVSADALTAAVRDLGLDMAATDIFITHLHSDHAGLSQMLATPSTRVYMSEEDGRIVMGGKASFFWEGFKEFYHYTGLFQRNLVNSVEQHPGYAYAPPETDNMTFVPNGHVFTVGRRRLQCILTKGHTPGHTCLYDPEDRILFSGDHILGKITPNITQMTMDHNALAEYLASLDLVAKMEVRAAFPGHRVRIDDVRGRIEELRRHHEKRLDEVRVIVRDGEVDTVEVTRRMKWSLTIENWDEYPPAQKIFSAGEALAHLYYLAELGEMRMTRRDGVYYFKMA